MSKRALDAFLISFILTLRFTAPETLIASPLEDVFQTGHNLMASKADASKSCTVCHTDEIPWQKDKDTASGKKTSKVVSPPPLWQKSHSGTSPYRAIQNLPAGEHPYNHPTGTSMVCLSCHDGALGTDMHGINVDDPRVGAPANVPFDGMWGKRGAPPLSRLDHPISIPYPRLPNGKFTPLNPTVTQFRYWALPDRQADGLVLPTSGTSAYLDLPVGAVSGSDHLSSLVRTTGGRLECDSCHNPHSEQVRPFLRAPAANLCLVCHDR
ncbi:MAG: cytochrome c3 family protein [Nitrospirota bacterium]|nr:cytochrome c3 family protein [Nitrospirota bacterium]